MSETTQEIKAMADEAIKNSSALQELIGNLSGSSRRLRQQSAASLALVAKESPELLVGYTEELTDALNRPEAQTRWECLDVLTELIDLDSRACDKAIAGAETALFDEESGPVRLAAMRFICGLGATTTNRSEKLWSLIDEGIQCYHGDLEFSDMLTAIVEFSAGKISPEVKLGLQERMRFDAENSKGTLRLRAEQIMKNVS